MFLNKKTTAMTAALCALSVSAFAQTAPAHQSLLGRLLHHKPAATSSTPMAHHSMMPFHKPMSSGMAPHHSMMPFHHATSGTTAMSGQIIGNKHSHVYHLPGQPGALPAPQNRVYFSSAAAAQAAGYHAAGSAHGSAMHHMTHK